MPNYCLTVYFRDLIPPLIFITSDFDYRDSSSFLSIKENSGKVTVIPLVAVQYFQLEEA